MWQWVEWVVAVLAVWLLIAVIVGVLIGRAVSRADAELDRARHVDLDRARQS